MNEPTNADLMKEFKDHEAKDLAFQEATTVIHTQMTERMGTLATKEDIKELLEFMKTVNMSAAFFRFTWNNAAKIGSFILIILAIYAFFKGGFVAALAWLFGKSV